MPTDFAIGLEDRPGELAKLGQALGEAGVNVLGFCATTSGGQGEVHLLVEDAGTARTALESLGIVPSAEREMAVLDVEDAPGTLGEVAAGVAERGGNIELAYTMVGGTRLAIGADDPSAVAPQP
jgi:hypothetical protein